MEFLHSFLRRHFAGEPAVASFPQAMVMIIATVMLLAAMSRTVVIMMVKLFIQDKHIQILLF